MLKNRANLVFFIYIMATTPLFVIFVACRQTNYTHFVPL